MINNYKELIDCALNFLESKKVKLSSPLVCDHICYRVTSNEQYLELKSQFEISDIFVHEANVRGRAISIFKFKSPIIYKGLQINCLELPAPKNDNKYEEGYEHLEFVVVDLNGLINNNLNLQWDTSGIKRELNPELALQISDSFQIKFHPLDILEVVSIERELGLKEIK